MASRRVSLGRGKVPDAKADIEWEADVVIVGGAVAGASMAHALAEYDISSVVLERTAKVSEINRGDVLQPLSLMLFNRWGVYQHVEKMGGFPLYEWNFHSPRIGHLGTWDFSPLPIEFNHQTILRHVRIHEALYAAMEDKKDMIDPQRGADVTGLLLDEKTDAAVGVYGECEQGTFEARGKLVVAADGPRSRIRQFLNIEQEERYTYDHEYLMLTVPRPKVPEMDRRGMQYIGRHGLVVLIPLDGGEDVRIPVQIPLGSFPTWRKLTETQLRDRLLVRAPILEHVDTSSAMDNLSHSYAVFWRHSERYVKNNICLIGEAARTIHPTTAQGMNIAILDCEILAAVIKRCFVQDGISDETLRAYEKARHPVTEDAMETSHHQTLHHTDHGVWHDIWGVRMYRWIEDDEIKQDLSMSISGMKNPTSKDLGILDGVEVNAR